MSTSTDETRAPLTPTLETENGGTAPEMAGDEQSRAPETMPVNIGPNAGLSPSCPRQSDRSSEPFGAAEKRGNGASPERPAQTGQDAPTACAKCGRLSAAGSANCAHCGAFLPGNQAALVHGAYSRAPLPENLRLHGEELRAAIVADLGGLRELSALEATLVRRLVDADIVCTRMLVDIIGNGALTNGRPRPSISALLAATSTVSRLADQIGLKRRQRRVVDPIDYIEGRVDGADGQ